MKIINQTESELSIKDGNSSNIFLGTIIALVGIGVGYASHFSDLKVLLVGLVFFVVGLSLFLFSSVIIVNFSKTNGQFTYTKKSLIKKKSEIYNIIDILQIEIRQQWQTQSVSSKSRGISMPRQFLVSQSIIVLKNGQELPLNHQKKNSSSINTIFSSSSVLMGGKAKESALANQIANFLNVPFQEISPTSGISGINIGSLGGINN